MSAPAGTEEILKELTGVRRRIDHLRDDWDSRQEVDHVIRGLDELSLGCAAYPSIAGLLSGAARLIERGEPADHRLEKLSDHLHGYVVGWEDAAQSCGSDP